MQPRLIIVCLAVAAGALAWGPASAQTPPDAPSPAEPAQFFVLSFKDEPIAEVAEAVVGGALSQSVAIDPAIDDVISFQAEGAFTPDALLADFGEALLDRDVALLRSSQGDLELVLRANLADELAKGAVLVATSTPVGSASPAVVSAPKAAKASAIVYGRDRWRDGPLGALLLFLAGVGTGALGLRAGQIIRSRRVRPVPVRQLTITRSANPDQDPVGDADLVIPRFRSSEDV